MCMEWSEMNERGISKPDIVSDFKFRSKCMFGAVSTRSLLRQFKYSQTSFSGPKCIKNVWRPGSARTRWESLSAPPEPLAAVDEDNYYLSPQFGAHCGEGGECICDEWAEMNERG